MRPKARNYNLNRPPEGTPKCPSGKGFQRDEWSDVTPVADFLEVELLNCCN